MRHLVLILLTSAATCGQELTFTGRVVTSVVPPIQVETSNAHAFYVWSASALVQMENATILTQKLTVTAPAGEHWIACIGIDGRIVDDQIRYDQTSYRREFRVGIPNDGGDDDDDDDDPPDPPADGVDYAKIEQVARDKAKELNDANTVKELLVALRDTLQDTQGKTLAELQASYREHREAAFLRAMRDPQSRFSDWLSWRQAVAATIPAQITAQQYLKILRAIGRGLTGSQDLTKRITMFSRADCVACENWKREQAWKFQQAGFRVEYATQSAGMVPAFAIRIGDITRHHVGYVDGPLVARIFGKDRQ